MSIRPLLTMAEKLKSKVTCGDTGNALPNTPTKEKLRAVDGEEFGERLGCIVELIKRLCGMSTASMSFALYLGDFITALGFIPAQADPDKWIKKDPNYDGCSRASTHVDDFLIIVTDPEPIMEGVKNKFDTRHEDVNLTSYLGLQ